MLKQTWFLVHRGTDIPAGSIIICGHCEMPIWRMTADLNHLKPHFGYHGIPKRFVTSLDGGTPGAKDYRDDPFWACPECRSYIVENTAVFFELSPYFAYGEDGLDPGLGHRLRFFIDYEGIR